MNYIIGVYLTTGVDVQRNLIKEKDDVAYIWIWYKSILKLGLQGVLYHDGLSQEFMDKFPGLTFKQIPSVPEGTQLYDYRWFIFRDSFKDFEINNVFFTDVSDVKVVKNPFIQPEYNVKTLFCGDVESPPSLLKSRTYINEELVKLPGFTEIMTSNKKLLNCGTFGGHGTLVLRFLDVLTYAMTRTKDRPIDNKTDIPLFNYIMYRYFSDCIVSGKPVNSVFKQYEDRNDVWFLHK